MTTLPKLICVDDDPHIVASLARLLGRDFNVLEANDAASAIKLIEENPDVAIVLADQDLPGMNGLQLLEHVQTKTPDAIRALFSGHLKIDDLVGAINTSRIHRLILKPWENDYFRVQMLESLANHSTLREKRQLEALSITDSVTGLKNHRYFQDRLRIETERSTRHVRPLALAMIDIDHFKKINDTYGHPVGDLVLKGVALRILDQVRSIDTVARYGGEEFSVIMPDTSIEDALRVCERIRASFEKAPFIFPQLPRLDVTVSVGIVTHVGGRPASDLVVRADEAMYRAKGQGRNRTFGG